MRVRGWWNEVIPKKGISMKRFMLNGISGCSQLAVCTGVFRAMREAITLGLLVFAACTAPAVYAQSTWNGTTNGLWSVDSNWSTAPGGNGFNTGLVFAGANNLSTNNDLTSGTATSITFNAGAGAFTLAGNQLTLSGSVGYNGPAGTQTISLPMVLTATTHTFALTGGGTMVFSGPLSGGVTNGNSNRTISLASSGGTGVVVLSASNNFTGNISNSGTTQLYVNNASALGSGLLEYSGGTLTLDNSTGSPVTVANNFRATGASPNYGITGVGGTLLTTGTFFFGGGTGGRTLTVNTGTLGFSVLGSGAQVGSSAFAGLTKSGAGTLIISGPADPSITGTVAFSSGKLILGHSSALGTGPFHITGSGTMESTADLNLANAVTGSGSPVFAGASSLTFSGGFTQTGTNRTITNNIVAGKSLTFSSTTLLAESGTTAARTLTVSGTGSTVFSGPIANGSGGGASGLTINAANGTVTLSNTNTYTGNTTVTAGVLVITSTAALPGAGTAGRWSAASAATLAVTNAVLDSDVSALANSGNFAAGSRLGFDTSAGDRTYAQPLSGSLAFGIAKLGGNTLTLNITSSGTLNGNSLISSGTLAVSQTADYKFLGTIGGTGVLAKTGGNTLTLDTTGNTWSGGLQITGGGVIAKSIGSGPVSMSGSATQLSLNSGTYNQSVSIANVAGPAGGQGAIDTQSNSSVTFNGSITLSGSITGGSSSNGLFGASPTGLLTINGPITVSQATLPVSQARGKVVYAGGGTYESFVLKSGTTALGATNGLSSTASLTLGTTGAGTLDLGGFNQTLVGITRGATAATIGNSSTTSDSMLSVTGTSTFSGSIVDAVATGTRKTGLAVNGGSLTLSGSNTYTGQTSVNAGCLFVNGSLTSDVLLAGGVVGGSGSIGAISGLGLVTPGNSPGILTASSVNPSSGIAFAFEFSAATPTYTNVTNSGNDVLWLTGGTPFTSVLSGSNTVNVYFTQAAVELGTLTGGFFTSNTGDFLASVGAATFQFFVQDVNGSTVYNNSNYKTLAQYDPSKTVTISTVAENGGQVMQMVVVPEPGALLLAGMGVVLAAWTARRRAR